MIYFIRFITDNIVNFVTVLSNWFITPDVSFLWFIGACIIFMILLNAFLNKVGK